MHYLSPSRVSRAPLSPAAENVGARSMRNMPTGSGLIRTARLPHSTYRNRLKSGACDLRTQFIFNRVHAAGKEAVMNALLDDESLIGKECVSFALPGYR